jgi:hypothetical protein
LVRFVSLVTCCLRVPDSDYARRLSRNTAGDEYA